MYIGIHAKYSLFLPVLKKLEFCRQIVEKQSNIRFHEHSSSGSRVVPRRRTDGQPLISAFRNFANALKKSSLLCVINIVYTDTCYSPYSVICSINCSSLPSDCVGIKAASSVI